MAANNSKRENNYEIKYLRKVLGQVDSRIQIPSSLDAESLRTMLDGIEPAPREIARGRPRWLSVQSGIAYAAAFALIVALFYSTRLYRPEVIDGGMYITEQAAAQAPAALMAAPDDEAEHSAGTGEAVLFAGDTQDYSLEQDEGALATQEPADADNAPPNVEINLGFGGGQSKFLTEQDEIAYYARNNDLSDPDKTSPVTLEVVDTTSDEIIAQININGTEDIEQCFIYGDKLLVVGETADNMTLHVYDDGGNPANPLEQTALTQTGTFVNANIQDSVAYIISKSAEPPEGIETVALPNTSTSGTCIITAVNLDTLEVGQKAFTGAEHGSLGFYDSGDIQILYEGAVTDDNGQGAYENRILLDGLSIELEADKNS